MEEMNEYRLDTDHQNKPQADYYEQKFIVYLDIAESDLYSDKEKKDAFDLAYSQVEDILELKIEYYLRDDDFKNDKLRFRKLCNKYDKRFMLTIESDENIEKEINSDNSEKIIEEIFINKILKSVTKRQITLYFNRLSNERIVISKFESWKILIEKTFKINGNIVLFTNYLKKTHYPHMSYWSNNSKYFYLAVAAAIKDLNTRQEMLNYLYKHSGHGGFSNVMESYAFLEDKNMCITLFKRYLRICDFLVY